MLAAGLAGLLLVAGGVAAVLVVRLVGGEAEAQVLAQQRRRVDALANGLEAICGVGDCGAALRRQLGADLAEAVVLDRQLQVLAGPPDASLRRDAVVADAAQGGGLAWARVARGPEHARGAGVDQRVARGLTLADGRRAVLVAAFSLDALHEAVADHRRLIVLYLLFDFAAVLAFGMYLSGRYLVRPIRALTLATQDIGTAEIGEGADERRVPRLEGPSELVRLSTAFAEMVGRLREKNEALARSLADLQAARDELVRSEKLATVGRLAAGLAHEVGNPLAAVLGYVEYLRDDRGTPPDLQADLLARMDRELNRIRLTIRNLLDFSRPAPPEPSRVDPGEVARSAVELVRYQRKVKALDLEVEGEAPPAFVEGARLRQVLVNLLLNAADAVDGEGRVRVRLGATGAGGARIEVTDDGPGVPAEQTPHLFEPFHTTKPAGQGTGLGLAISRRLVEEAGGRLWLAEPLAGGATFVIELPPLDSGGPAEQAN